MHKGRIYISSTFNDLKEERGKVHSTIRRMNYDAARMEDMVASDVRPVDQCLIDVRECDIYIGIIGWRYGFITELEYEEAARCKIPRLIFLLKKDLSDPRISSMPGNLTRRLTQYYSQPKQMRIKLAQFRERTRRECVVDFFSSLGELEGKVATALSRLEDELGIATKRNEVPHLLPYLSDRSEQNLILKRELRNQKEAEPFFCIIHGEQREALHKYLEIVNKSILANSLTNHAERNIIAAESIQWPPVSADHKERFEILLETQFERLNHRLSIHPQNNKNGEKPAEWMHEFNAHDQTTTVAVDDLALFTQSTVNRYRVPIMLECHVQASDWQIHEIDLIGMWFDFWRRLDLHTPVFVFLAVHYQDLPQKPTTRKDRIRRKNQQIRQSIQSQAFARMKVVVLPELKPITRTEAIEWASSRGRGGEWLDKQGCEPYDSQYLIDCVHKIYNEEMATMDESDSENFQITIPMANLGAKLKHLLLPCKKHKFRYASSV